jgi:hypothetical protein
LTDGWVSSAADPRVSSSAEGWVSSIADPGQLGCRITLGFLSWVPEVPKAADQSPIPPACLLAAIRRVPVNYRAGQLTAMEWSLYQLRSDRGSHTI